MKTVTAAVNCTNAGLHAIEDGALIRQGRMEFPEKRRLWTDTS